MGQAGGRCTEAAGFVHKYVLDVPALRREQLPATGMAQVNGELKI